MKKLLLLASAALLAGTAFAADDTYAYPEVDGIKCENLWLKSRTLGNYANSDLPFCVNQDYDRSRTCAIKDNYLIIAYSHKIMQGEELNSGSAHLILLDLNTGAYLRTLQCTVDGKTIDDLLASNTVGVDDFGNVWFCAYRNDFIMSNGNYRNVDIFVVDDLATGACSKAFTVTLPEEEANAGPSRTDFYDIVGDVRGEQAGTVLMTVGCENSPEPLVFGWRRDQGSSKFEPHMSDYSYVSQPVETYPADQVMFSYGSMVYICRDEDHTGDLFYVDGFTTYPALYNTAGEKLEDMSLLDDTNTEDCLPLDRGANGFVEFTIAGKPMAAYPTCQYNQGMGWQFNVVAMGEGPSFEGMKKMWTLPNDGQGTLTDGGIRMHSLKAQAITDGAGKEGVLLAQFKTNGGVGVYRIAEKDFDAGVQDIFADNADENAPVEYFNLQGARVNNPAAGQMVIKRQGSKAVKELVR